MWTREFLHELAHGEATQLSPEELRMRARTLLRHYVLPGDVELVHRRAPEWFASPFPDDKTGG